MPVGECNMTCPNCVQLPWRKDYNAYQMLPQEVAIICKRIKDQGLHFEWAHITGGEPSTWVYLEEGCKIIKDSGAFDLIEVWSNCRITKPLSKLMDSRVVELIHTQSANMSKDGAALLLKKYGPRMDIIPSAGHQVNPEQPLDDVLPATCGCDRVTVFNYRVYSCANAYSCSRRAGMDMDNPRIWVSVYDDWVKFIDGMDRFNQQYCRMCLANGKVSARMPLGKVR